MKTDVIEISPTGEGMTEALRQTEKAAAFQQLTPKQGLRLALRFSEEECWQYLYHPSEHPSRMLWSLQDSIRRK